MFDIDSYNFYGVWEGDIEVFNTTTTVNANISLSWSNASFYLNDELIESWKSQDKTVALTLNKGVHRVRIDHHNHWHTTEFNVSFIDYPQLKIKDVESFDDIESLILEDTKVIYIGAYETNTRYNEASINVSKYDGSVVLFFGSYSAVNWVIDNPSNTTISGVIFNSRKPGSTIQNIPSAPIFEITDFSTSGYRDLSRGVSDILTLTGKRPDYSLGRYYISQINIPTFE